MWLKVALGLSMAVNLFIAGFVLARAPLLFSPPPFPQFGPGGPPHPGPPRDLVPGLGGHFQSVLSPEDIKAIEPILEGQRDKAAALFRAIDAGHDQVRAALRREPFDPAALQAAGDAVTRAHQALGNEINATMVAIAAKLSADGRAKLAATLR